MWASSEVWAHFKNKINKKGTGVSGYKNMAEYTTNLFTQCPWHFERALQHTIWSFTEHNSIKHLFSWLLQGAFHFTCFFVSRLLSCCFYFFTDSYFLQPNRWLREFTKAFFKNMSTYVSLDNITKSQLKYLEGFMNDCLPSDEVSYIIPEKLIVDLIRFATSAKSK